ncbi:MAG: adenylyl-sulfate kinase [Ornithinimicrobium sp.]
MGDVGVDVPRVLPDPWVLDDVELLRQGVAVPVTGPEATWTLDVPRVGEADDVRQVVIIEPEGVPMAHLPVRPAHAEGGGGYVPSGPPTLVGRRPARPFERWHRGVDAVPAREVTVVLDRRLDATEVAAALPTGSSVLVVLVAAVERDGETQAWDVDLARHAERLCLRLPQHRADLAEVDLAIVPVARDHPRRAERIAACVAAYGGDGLVVDLTGPRDDAVDTPGRGAVLFFTGLSGSGKSTLAKALRNLLLERSERSLTLLDGDVVRHHLSAGLGFSPADRDRNIRRIGWVAARIAEHGGLAICSPIAPYERTRQAVAQMTSRAGGDFVLIHVATPVEECERRDRKGLYARARRGEIADFTGVSSPYEEPREADLRLDTTGQDVDELVGAIVDLGVRRGLWSAPEAGW